MSRKRRCASCGATVDETADVCPYCLSPSELQTAPGGLVEKNSTTTAALTQGVVTPPKTSAGPNDELLTSVRHADRARISTSTLGASIRNSAKLDLRREIEESLRGSESRRGITGFGSSPTSQTVTALAMPEQKEEYKTSHLSVISYGGSFSVEFRPGKDAPGDIVEGRPVQNEINMETIKGLEEVYIGQVLNGMRTVARADRENMILSLKNFRGLIDSFGQILSNALGGEVMGSISRLEPGSRLHLRLDEMALGIPWELAYQAEKSSILGLQYSIGKTVVSNVPTRPNKRGPRKETSVLMIDAATDPTFGGGPVLKGFLPVLVQLEHLLQARGVRVRKILGKDATLWNVRSALAEDNDIVIFNTHGGFGDSQPTTSLAAYDGFLYSQDIEDVYIGSAHPPPLLWVSYACETGTQRGWDETTESLPSTLNRLNVPLVAPYWPAWGSAEETSTPEVSSDILLSAFFDRIFASPPCAIGDALMLAKRTVFEGKEAVIPDWANFTLYGSPSLTIGIRR